MVTNSWNTEDSMSAAYERAMRFDKAIKDMNDGEGAYISEERMAYVSQQGGEVDRIKLPDVQRQLSKQMIEQMKGRGRG